MGMVLAHYSEGLLFRRLGLELGLVGRVRFRFRVSRFKVRWLWLAGLGLGLGSGASE